METWRRGPLEAPIKALILAIQPIILISRTEFQGQVQWCCQEKLKNEKLIISGNYEFKPHDAFIFFIGRTPYSVGHMVGFAFVNVKKETLTPLSGYA